MQRSAVLPARTDTQAERVRQPELCLWPQCESLIHGLLSVKLMCAPKESLGKVKVAMRNSHAALVLRLEGDLWHNCRLA